MCFGCLVLRRLLRARDHPHYETKGLAEWACRRHKSIVRHENAYTHILQRVNLLYRWWCRCNERSDIYDTLNPQNRRKSINPSGMTSDPPFGNEQRLLQPRPFFFSFLVRACAQYRACVLFLGVSTLAPRSAPRSESSVVARRGKGRCE